MTIGPHKERNHTHAGGLSHRHSGGIEPHFHTVPGGGAARPRPLSVKGSTPVAKRGQGQHSVTMKDRIEDEAGALNAMIARREAWWEAMADARQANNQGSPYAFLAGQRIIASFNAYQDARQHWDACRQETDRCA